MSLTFTLEKAGTQMLILLPLNMPSVLTLCHSLLLILGHQHPPRYLHFQTSNSILSLLLLYCTVWAALANEITVTVIRLKSSLLINQHLTKRHPMDKTNPPQLQPMPSSVLRLVKSKNVLLGKNVLNVSRAVQLLLGLMGQLLYRVSEEFLSPDPCPGLYLCSVC